MLDNIKNIYFLGIGGIGMSALAHWTHLRKINTQGWDDDLDTPTLVALIKSGIIVHNNNRKSQFFLDIDQLNNKNTIIIYTPAISKDHAIFRYFKLRKFPIFKRADLLEFVSKNYQVIAIAGTHGKTTISIMLSHILRSSGIGCNAFFGGISNNYDSNFLIGDSEIMVIEADEYDKSFLKLSPTISLISSMDKDHGDVYNNYDVLLESYQSFINSTKETIIAHYDLNNKFDFTYSLSSSADFFGSDQILIGDQLFFTINFPDKTQIKTYLLFGSDHNVENAIAAASLAFVLGVSPRSIGDALMSFKGVKRRFEYHINSKECVMIDDYAHHPKELRVLIMSLKAHYAKQELFLIFQPHLFSRTKEFEDEFIDVLSLVDKLILLNIYPARETPISGVTSKNLLDKIRIQDKWYLDMDSNYSADSRALRSILLKQKPSLLVTAGAGDIYKLIPDIKSILK